ncbi:MAG: GNAT family N-acetyltransferase [Candidatus Pacebacteria bacterium]|nr:GNAT family N-acetyltransferase [Candidatus Paceibacterota bacterium]
MQEFKSEFVHSYHTYSFGYCNYAIKEKKDILSDIYNKGYLPYSGEEGIKNILYMARSARVNLKDFVLNSENRRVLRKFDDKFEFEKIPLNKFNFKDKKFIKFCLNYFEKKHGDKIMPKKRLETVLKANFITNILVYKDMDGDIIAYVYEVDDKKISHVWLYFYDLDYSDQSLGMWLMIDMARRSKLEGKKYFYVGTIYGEKALYKTNFDFLEYWNGNEWIKNKKKLKQRSRSDYQREFNNIDEFKEGKNIDFK